MSNIYVKVSKKFAIKIISERKFSYFFTSARWTSLYAFDCTDGKTKWGFKKRIIKKLKIYRICRMNNSIIIYEFPKISNCETILKSWGKYENYRKKAQYFQRIKGKVVRNRYYFWRNKKEVSNHKLNKMKISPWFI